MKTPFLFHSALFYGVFLVLFASCGPSPVSDFYRVQLPSAIALQTEILGESCWRLEYYDSGGNFCRKEITGKSTANIKLNILEEWPSAILAWPYWPDKLLDAGLMYPAGALYPFDAAGNTVVLSWEAGAEAYFYRELDKAQEFNTGTNRSAKYFDWKRFRTLLREDSPDELRADPWLADWKSIAEKTVRGGFRQSYVQAEKRPGRQLTIPHAGPWFCASPFQPIENWEKGEEVTFLLSSRPEVFVCPGGRFNVSSNMQVWAPFP